MRVHLDFLYLLLLIIGRLASYKYFNMDQAILNALELFDKLVQEGKIEKKSEWSQGEDVGL